MVSRRITHLISLDPYVTRVAGSEERRAMSQDAGGRNPVGASREPLPRAAYRELDDRSLIDAMRRSDERAIDEFLVRHQRLLYDRVGRWRMRLDDVEDCISDVLEDVAVLIVTGRIRPTRSRAAYVVKVFRVTLARRSAADDSHRRLQYEAADEMGGIGQRAVASTVSESTVRASHGMDWEPLPVPTAITRLATMLDDSLSEEERRVLTWLSNFVAQRDISDWLGVTYEAGTQRIWRLRERLRATARRYADRRMKPPVTSRSAPATRRQSRTEDTLDEGA
jgi:hypothetical protein